MNLERRTRINLWLAGAAIDLAQGIADILHGFARRRIRRAGALTDWLEQEIIEKWAGRLP